MKNSTYRKALSILIALQISACASTDTVKHDAKPLADTWRQANNAYSEKEWHKAQILYEIIVERFPDDSEAHFRMGVAAYRQGNRQLAEKSFSQVVSLEPGSTKAAYNLSIIKLNEAYELIMQCAKNAPNETEKLKYTNLAKRIAEIQRPSR